MYNIRLGCFETNSSSTDYYRVDDYDDVNIHATGRQLVNISIDWDEELSCDKIDQLVQDIVDNYEDNIVNIIEDIFDEDDEPEYDGIDNMDDGDICMYFTITAKVVYTGKFYPATRDEPAEYPDPEFIYSGVPTKMSDTDKVLVHAQNELKKLLHEYSGIKNIHVVGREIDEDTFRI